MTDNSYKILEYLKQHNRVTALEVSKALGIEKRLVDSYFSAAIAKAGMGVRTSDNPAKLEINEKGMEYTQ